MFLKSNLKEARMPLLVCLTIVIFVSSLGIAGYNLPKKYDIPFLINPNCYERGVDIYRKAEDPIFKDFAEFEAGVQNYNSTHNTEALKTSLVELKSLRESYTKLEVPEILAVYHKLVLNFFDSYEMGVKAMINGDNQNVAAAYAIHQENLQKVLDELGRLKNKCPNW